MGVSKRCLLLFLGSLACLKWWRCPTSSLCPDLLWASQAERQQGWCQSWIQNTCKGGCHLWRALPARIWIMGTEEPKAKVSRVAISLVLSLDVSSRQWPYSKSMSDHIENQSTNIYPVSVKHQTFTRLLREMKKKKQEWLKLTFIPGERELLEVSSRSCKVVKCTPSYTMEHLSKRNTMTLDS